MLSNPNPSTNAADYTETPIGRLRASGAAALSDAELVAIICRGARALDCAAERDTIREAGGLDGLYSTPPAARSAKHRDRFERLAASAELERRRARGILPERDLLGHPAAVARYLALRYALPAPDQEVMGALYLDIRNRLIGDSELFRGTLSRAAAEPRAILKEGLLCGAAGLIVFHTHPSGDPSPSAEDLAFTRRLAEAGEIVGVRLVDHLIVGVGGAWTSLRQRGAW